MSLESIHTSSTAREEAIERLRETFEQRAKELADKYSVDSSEVLYLYALKMGRQVEKNRNNEVLLQKIFSDPILEDTYWDMVEDKLKADIKADTIEARLNQEIESKDKKLAEEIVRREEAEKAATIDGLTGLPNRRAFENKLQENIHAFNTSKNKFSVILLDIDNFKGINDKFGHPVGDRVLREIGVVIHSCLRGSDFAARYGGEEIAIIVETSGDQVQKLLTRIETQISEIDPRTVGVDPEIRSKITASLGFAEYDSETQNVPGEDIVSRADKAMYANKQAKKITSN